MTEINKLELKKKILLELATSFIDLNIHGVTDQYPICAVLVFPNLVRFREDIFLAIKENINNYSEIMLIQILQLFSFRIFRTPSDIYNLVLDNLIEKRKDPTLKESFDLANPKKINLNEITDFNYFKKSILWAEINIDIEYPIFRGFGFNIYTMDDVFYKEYNLSTGKFIYSGKIIEKPIYLMTGHNQKSGVLTNYRFYGVLQQQPKYPEFEDDADKIKYTIDKILYHLGVNKIIDKKDVTLDIKDIKSIPENLTSEEKDRYIQNIYEFLKKVCGIE